jgi:hypothetical protein
MMILIYTLRGIFKIEVARANYTHTPASQPMIQSIIGYIESLGYVLVGVQDAARKSRGWMRPRDTFARDALTFMSREHAQRNTMHCAGIVATRVDTLRIFQTAREDHAQHLALAHRARELGRPTSGRVTLDIQWDETQHHMDKDILRGLVTQRTPRGYLRKRTRAIDVLIIARVESYDAIGLEASQCIASCNMKQ